MSQRKVDEYKKYKANRKEILAKEKAAKKRNKLLGTIATVAVVLGFGYWGIYTYKVETAPKYNFYSMIAQNQYGILEPELVEVVQTPASTEAATGAAE